MRYSLLLLLLSVVACDHSFRGRTEKYALVGELLENRAAVYDANVGGWGYVDTTGLLAIPCHFEGAAPFSEGLAVVRTHQLYGYINTQGEQVIGARYRKAEAFTNGYARVQAEELWGIIDRTGRQVIPCDYTLIEEPLPNGWIPVSRDNLHGFITTTGYPVVPCSYDQLTPPDPYGLIHVMQRAKYGLLNARGEELLPCIFSYIGHFHEGRARLNLGGRIEELGKVPEEGTWGIIDTTGLVMLSCRHYWLDDCRQGRILFQNQENGPFGYLDAWGHIAIEAQFRAARPFDQGVAVVSRNGKDFGLINREGELLCKFQFRYIGSFYEGLAVVHTDPFALNYPGMKHRCGYINTQGEAATPLDYDDAAPFSEGYAAVLRYGVTADFHDARWGYINRHGTQLTPFIYHEAEPFHLGVARVRIKAKGYGFINTRGVEIIACRYDDAGTYDNGMIWVSSDNQRLLFDQQGNPIEK